MSRFVTGATETKRLINELDSLKKQNASGQKAIEENTKELAKINAAKEKAVIDAINAKEKEIRRNLEKVQWVRYDNDVYHVKKHSILNKLDII